VYQVGDDVDIICQMYGEVFNGNKIWDYTQDNCFVTDYYLRTGYGVIFKGECAPGGKANGTEVAVSSGTAKPTKATSAKSTRSAKPTSELGSIDGDASESSASGPRLTKLPAPSHSGSSDTPTSGAQPSSSKVILSSATKLGSASSLAAGSGSLVALSAALVSMVALF
ncbi:hypothetical protein GGI12_004182, partial [Dipsacomyces acuminosporus]